MPTTQEALYKLSFQIWNRKVVTQNRMDRHSHLLCLIFINGLLLSQLCVASEYEAEAATFEVASQNRRLYGFRVVPDSERASRIAPPPPPISNHPDPPPSLRM